MKQTAIQISMINNNINNSNNTQTGEPQMTSLEIAQLTGKQHKHVMEAIRKMEPAWAKVCGSNFRLTSRAIEQPNGGIREIPCYSLSKTETLYIATKFNDEARAKLVIRWEELERERRLEQQRPKQKIKEIRLLASDEEVLDEADDILGDELERLNRGSRFCYTPTEIGKPFGLDGRDLNSFLCDRGIIRWARGQWRLTQKYMHQDLTEDRFNYVHALDGHRKLISSLVWTEKGRQFIIDLICGK